MVASWSSACAAMQADFASTRNLRPANYRSSRQPVWQNIGRPRARIHSPSSAKVRPRRWCELLEKLDWIEFGRLSQDIDEHGDFVVNHVPSKPLPGPCGRATRRRPKAHAFPLIVPRRARALPAHRRTKVSIPGPVPHLVTIAVRRPYRRQGQQGPGWRCWLVASPSPLLEPPSRSSSSTWASAPLPPDRSRW